MHQAYDLLQNKEGFNLWSKKCFVQDQCFRKKLSFLVIITKKGVQKPLLDLEHINIYVYYTTFIMSDLCAGHP